MSWVRQEAAAVCASLNGFSSLLLLFAEFLKVDPENVCLLAAI